MKVLTAPNRAAVPSGYKTLFLAGGITNCPDWQQEMIKLLHGYKVMIYNPRRENFPINEPTAAATQIQWEFDHLQSADMVLFWFARGSDNPIVLFEYGRHGINAERPVFVGADLEYSRRQDVIMQTKFAQRTYHVHGQLSGLADAVKSQLVLMPKYGPGKQLVEVHRFKTGNQGQISKEGELYLNVKERRLELSTFRICCSDFLTFNNVLVTEFLNKLFLVAYEQDGVMTPCKGDGMFQISLAGYDPQWCRKCGAEVSPPGCTPGPVCNACCTACR
jgi:hypothetical protein